ncbi:unnamed protein product [Ectocarpus sp. CCAP 1310/34]|nr:unnamed protein product [Ectocarpus sp. CCAP 1310/34]
MYQRKKSTNFSTAAALGDDDDVEDEKEEQSRRTSNKTQFEASTAAAMMRPPAVVDSRDADELEEDMRRGLTYRHSLKKLGPLLPRIGREGFPSEEGGIYDAHSSSQIRYKTGMEKDEFDAFYEDTFLDAEGNRLARSCLFGQARNHVGNYSAEDNKARRVIRGSMDDRDRVLCWLEMLRRDTLFEDMALAYGRCAGTYHNEFKDTTAAAQNMPCLQEEAAAGDLSNEERRFNTEQRRFRVVAENTIGKIKKWKAVGNGKAFRHRRDFEKDVFDVCARLTARIMRVRDRYPRSPEWTGRVKEAWEVKLGIHLYWDYEDPKSYLVHNEGENYVYGVANEGTAQHLQQCWDSIWALEI